MFNYLDVKCVSRSNDTTFLNRIFYRIAYEMKSHQNACQYMIRLVETDEKEKQTQRKIKQTNKIDKILYGY